MNGHRKEITGMQERAIIVSQKFNVAHCSHILAWQQLLKKIGMETKLFLDERYERYINRDEADFICENEIKQYHPNIIVINNISLREPRFVADLKKHNPSVRVYLVYHEPWRGLINEINRYIGVPKDFIKQVGRCICVSLIANKLEAVLLASDSAIDMYRKYNNICPRYYYLPLLFRDETNSNIITRKEYFSYISTASYDKAIDVFFEFAKWAVVNDKKIKFQVVTKTNIDNYIDENIQELINSGRMIIIHGRTLTIDEINEAYNRSNCTWMVYRSSTQSGVLPKTLMWGAPCVASNVGEFSKVINGKNGIIISHINAFDEIMDAYNEIQDNFEKFFNESRKTFLEKYCVDRYVDYFRSIIDDNTLVHNNNHTQ